MTSDRGINCSTGSINFLGAKTKYHAVLKKSGKLFSTVVNIIGSQDIQVNENIKEPGL